MTNPGAPADGQLSGAPPASERVAIWEDFIDIFHSPSEVFARRENGSFWIPTLIVTVLIGGLTLATSGVLSPMMDAEFQRGTAAVMRANPQVTAEQLATGRHIGEIIAKVGAFILVPIVVFLVGFFLWAIGKMFDATESFRTALVVAAYAMVPRVLETVLYGAQAMFMDPASLTSHYSVSLSAARFVNPDTASPVSLAILAHFDVFTFWLLLLLAIGLSVTGKIPRSRAAMAAALLWVVGFVPGLIQAARS